MGIRAPQSSRRGHRPRLPPRLILLRQRSHLRRQWHHRTRRANNLLRDGISHLLCLLFVCFIWTASYLATSLALSRLNPRLFTSHSWILVVWHSALYAATFLHALFIELGLTTTHTACRGGLNSQYRASTLLPRDANVENKPLRSSLVTIFIAGTGARTVSLRLYAEQSVSDVVSLLRRRRHIPDSRRIRQYLTFPSYTLAPLDECVRLRDIGVSNGSTLHFRMCVLGGARDSEGYAGDNPAWCAKFEQRHGKFPSARPQDWNPLGGKSLGLFECLVCEGNPEFDRKRIRDHETTQRHKHGKKRKVEMEAAGCNAGGISDLRTAPPLEEAPHSDPAAAAPPVPSATIVGAVRAALLDVLEDMQSSARHADNADEDASDHGGFIDWNAIDSPVRESTEDALVTRLSQQLHAYLRGDGAISDDSEDESREGEEDGRSRSDDEEVTVPEVPKMGPRRRRPLTEDDNPCFPWPDKETCVLDILRHVPRCAFSDRQNTVIHWALLALGVKDVPTQYAVDQVAKTLQKCCGVASVRHEGALGHVYYVNDLAAIIAQEMSNPRVRPHLRTLPEDTGAHLSQAWQAARWKDELDPDLATPMVRRDGEDFYVFEPAPLQDGSVCMPIRWFTRGTETYALAWKMRPTEDKQGWIVLRHRQVEVNVCAFTASWTTFKESFRFRNVPDPRNIIGIEETVDGGISPWTHTDPEVGNRWRHLARGHRVVAFPFWLYCDDTSGNLSKKWNKHNSFLFTASGLPRHLVHREYNIHFLATSNLAPPLEMLDGIVEQLRDCQSSGIWAWDSVWNEMVLVIPSVLAMLGDNPMQSEFACHVGLAGNLFCRVCKVSRGPQSDNSDGHAAAVPQETHRGDHEPQHSDGGSDAASVASSTMSAQNTNTATRQKGRSKKLETMSEMIDRVQRFMSIGPLRARPDTLKELQSQFTDAQRIGGQKSVLDARTRTGVKDTYQAFFVEKLCSLTTKRGRTREDRAADVQAYLSKIPRVDEFAASPVWRIRDFDPHADTPVEILHVILLGFVKYLWRDSVSRLGEAEKKILTARLSSFDVSGLGLAPLSGNTLVTYAKSLVGRDFRAVAQAAPFVLHDLAGIPLELHKVWTALAHLVPLVWQPEIEDLTGHLIRLCEAIDHFLEATCSLTPRWFNKPKFHVILHLPRHIRRFGPAMLFATEGFESFNAVIRSHSIHSNHRAPSRDIAVGMAHHNRLRHFLSGGKFIFPHLVAGEADDDLDLLDAPPSSATGSTTAAQPTHSPWLQKMARSDHNQFQWRTMGPVPESLLTLNSFDTQILGSLSGIEDPGGVSDPGSDAFGICRGVSSAALPWTRTISSKHINELPGDLRNASQRRWRIAEKFRLRPGDAWCKPGGQSWVIWRTRTGDGQVRHTLGRAWEFLQLEGSPSQPAGKCDVVLLQSCAVGQRHTFYDMPCVTPDPTYALIPPKDILSIVNVQHNCYDCKCKLTESRTVWQEREQTSQRIAEVRHEDVPKYILNMAQMRDASTVSPFHLPFVFTETRETIVQRSAMQEIGARATAGAAPAVSDTSQARSSEGRPSQPRARRRANASPAADRPVPSSEAALHERGAPAALARTAIMASYRRPTTATAAFQHEAPSTSSLAQHAESQTHPHHIQAPRAGPIPPPRVAPVWVPSSAGGLPATDGI